MTKRISFFNRSGREVRCSACVLKWLGFACLCLGAISTAVIQRGVIHLEDQTLQSLYDLMKPGGQMFVWSSCAVVLSLLSAVAIPIYAKLVYEGWLHTADQKRYLLRLLGLALLSEFVYDWANRGVWLDLSVQNPVWALALAVVMLSIFRQLEKPGAGSILLRFLILAAACAWALLLQCYMGVLTLLLTAVFYFFSGKKRVATVLGALLCVVQFPAPFGMFFVHWYDGTKGKTPRNLFYVLYPLHLAVFGIAGRLIA